MLQCDELYDDAAFKPAPSISDHLIPAASRKLLSELPGVEHVQVTARHPIAELDYETSRIPVTVHLEAFSPFIPLNSADSGIPAVIFNFTVTNTATEPVLVSLMAAQQNFVGWDGKTLIDGVRNFGFGGNINNLTRMRDLTAVTMSNVRMSDDDQYNGQLALAVLDRPDLSIEAALEAIDDDVLAFFARSIPDHTAMLGWEEPRDVWSHFSGKFGQLPLVADHAASSRVSPEGETQNAALNTHFVLLPGQSRTIPVVLAWYYPNRYVTWRQSNLGVHDTRSKLWIGHEYNRRFGSVAAVLEYVRDNYERLCEQTRLYRDSLFDTTLPWHVVESAAAPVSTICTPTCMWNEDGRLYGFEGCHGASTTHGAFEGCCPLNCTHVWDYEMALAKLFPDLERSMRRTDLVEQMSPEGAIPHRTPLPLYVARPWNEFIGGPRNPAMDGELCTVLKTYREVRHGVPDGWFDEMWPRVKRLMAHITGDYDITGDGVILGEQPNTYDISIYGANTFIGSLYLAALRAGEEMAMLQGDGDLAQSYHHLFEIGRQKYDELCWTGEYYGQVVDMGEHTEQQFGAGCHVDQLLGQWWAHLLDLGYVLPEDHVNTAVRNIFKFNRRESFDPADQRPRVFMDERDRGLYICTWPHGGKPDVPTQYSDEVWSGLEYPVACMLWFEGEKGAALTILSDIRDRHDGTRRSPWNEVECGDHYVRAMASWSLLEAAAGYRYDAPSGTLAFAPTLSDAGDFRAFFITGDSWGVFSADEESAQVSVMYGELSLSEIQLDTGYAYGSVQLDGESVAAGVDRADGALVVRFSEPVRIIAGQVLAVVSG